MSWIDPIPIPDLVKAFTAFRAKAEAAVEELAARELKGHLPRR